MEQYLVTGMSCASCQAHVEKAVSKVPGVTNVTVSLLTNSMSVEGTASSSDIIKAVEKAGYGAKLKNDASADQAGQKSSSSLAGSLAAEEEALEDHETPVLKKRLISSVVLLVILMYFSMGASMWGWPVPAFIDNPFAFGVIEMFLAMLVMFINRQFFISGFKSAIHLAPNMDTLVAMGSGVSFAYSFYSLLAMAAAHEAGDMTLMMKHMDGLYFESAAMIVTLITVGKMLEAMSKGRTTDALKGLMKLAPKTAVLIRDGAEVTVPVEQVQTGDIFAVRPGESIPVDGVIVEGSGAVNESALTGESIPVDKTVDDAVSAATINQSGYLKCRATRVGQDTTLSQIIKMVSDAAATKAPIAKIADKVSGVFVPAVIGIAIVVTIIWLIAGMPFGHALSRGIAVLVISCPCALGLATPVAIMVGNGMGAKQGILFKTAVSLEETGKAQIVVLDKTGTITKGQPVVTDLVPAPGVSRDDLLATAASLEQFSEHPLAKAIVAGADKISLKNVTDFKALVGNGVSGQLDGQELLGGSLSFIKDKTDVSELEDKADQLAEQGKTPLLFTRGGRLLGMVAVADVIKEDSPEAIRQIRDMGIRVVMLTGDNQRTAQAIAKQAGVDAVIAGVLPDGKEMVIRRMQKLGKVIMVGDGINDAPALTRADIGMAIGAGTDVAIDAADVVLVKSRLSDVAAAIRLSRQTLKNIHENLFWAFFYNVICIPLAAGAYIPINGWEMNPMIGAAAMSLSSFTVCMNALRLNFFKVGSTKHDRRTKKEVDMAALDNEIAGLTSCPVGAPQASAEGGQDANADGGDTNAAAANTPIADADLITKTITVKGMMCEHCEMRVSKALMGVDGVVSATASFKEGRAVVKMNKDVDNALLKKAIEDQDYKVKKIA